MTTPSSPLTPHPHAAVIKAWADGAEIEFQNGATWEPIKEPNWYPGTVYRVKPTEPAAAPLDDLRRLLLEAEILQLRMAAAGAMEMAHQARSSNLLHDPTFFRSRSNQLDTLATKLEAFL